MSGKKLSQFIEDNFLMPNSRYAYQHYLLRSLSVQLQQPELKQLALQPGVQSVYRITCYYPHETPYNSVATLVSSRTGEPTLTVANELTANDKHLAFPIRDQIFRALVSSFSTLKFDKLEDQPAIGAQGVTLWLVERAAGSFNKSVLLAPESATEPHIGLIFQLHELLPQAVEPSGPVL